MKKLILLTLLGGIVALAASADFFDKKRNETLTKLTINIRNAQAARESFVNGWTAECKAAGKVLQQVDANLVGCVVAPQVPTPPAPTPAAEKK